MIRLITRSDDAGSSMGANEAIFEAVCHDFVKNVSLMAPGAYIRQAADVLKDKKHICFGMHFTMNAEWDRVKWGPVGPEDKVASLKDANGWFYANPTLSFRGGAQLEAIRAEWNAQLDLLTKLGFDVRYADSHMLPELVFDGLDDMMSEWIKKKGLVDHRYFYQVLPQMNDISGTSGLFEEVVAGLPDGQYFYLTHPAKSTQDMYLTGNSQETTENVVTHRRKDFEFITSAQTMALCRKYDVVPIRYDEAEVLEENRDSLRRRFAQSE